LTKNALAVTFALSCFAAGCTFKAPDANKPLGCACDPRPNAYAYCKYDACNYAGCRSGFFDLDQQPANGCEADRSQLPGNLVFDIGAGYYASWEPEFDRYSFAGKEGVATATVVDPMCKPTATHRCDLRLEALQMSLVATPNGAQGDKSFADAIISTTTPLAASESGNGGDFIDPPLSVSFGENGDRAPLLDSTGRIHVIIYPSTDGTVRLGISATFQGYVDDRKGILYFTASGKTPQLFDASAPDARARDASTDGDAATGDAVSDDATIDASVDGDDQ